MLSVRSDIGGTNGFWQKVNIEYSNVLQNGKSKIKLELHFKKIQPTLHCIIKSSSSSKKIAVAAN